MSKFQPVQFQDIDDFLAFLPENEWVIVQALRRLVKDCIPQAREKLSYNVPYFSVYHNICFIWPASVPWGKVQKDGVMLGFTKGNLLSDDTHYLETGNRKRVRTKTFYRTQDIDFDTLRDLLYEAMLTDKETASGKVSK